MNPFVGIAHMCVNTKDMKKTVDFYTKAMGFKVVHEELMGPDRKDHEMFPALFSLLKLGDLYIEVIEPRGYNKDNIVHAGVVGAIDHMGIEVSDIEAAVKQLRDYGVDQPMKISWSTDVFKDKPYRSAALTGPNGEKLGLYEFSNKVFFE